MGKDIITCKECKHRFTDKCALYYGCWFGDGKKYDYWCGSTEQDDFYCAKGEKEENGETKL